jgi:hypothetical protein
VNDALVPSNEDGDPLVRPFMLRSHAGPELESLVEGDGAREDVRPYLMTSGRTSAAGEGIAMETIVVRADPGPAGDVPLIEFERQDVLAECVQPCSVAEIAARLELPLMVTQVLVADMVAQGLLLASGTAHLQADDITFLERLIHGIRAL